LTKAFFVVHLVPKDGVKKIYGSQSTMRVQVNSQQVIQVNDLLIRFHSQEEVRALHNLMHEAIVQEPTDAALGQQMSLQKKLAIEIRQALEATGAV
jgi:hypothetical protein